MSSERKYTGMAKLFAIEEKQQKEKAAAKLQPLKILQPLQYFHTLSSIPAFRMRYLKTYYRRLGRRSRVFY